jgi:hypothetical protein
MLLCEFYELYVKREDEKSNLIVINADTRGTNKVETKVCPVNAIHFDTYLLKLMGDNLAMETRLDDYK